MSNNIPLRHWIINWNAGLYNKPDFETMCQANWYDWFCSQESLLPRLQKMVGKVKQIAKSPKIDVDNMYVFFKNNCPMWTNSTYDDFRICSLDPNSDKMYTIIPRFPQALPNQPQGFNMKCTFVSEVFDVEAMETVVSGTWWDVRRWFGV